VTSSYAAGVPATVNGQPAEMLAGATIADVVAKWCPTPRGVAVARNGEVVPRSTWHEERLRAGDAIEIVTAAAGG
jgi:sulfur carrier protein